MISNPSRLGHSSGSDSMSASSVITVKRAAPVVPPPSGPRPSTVPLRTQDIREAVAGPPGAVDELARPAVGRTATLVLGTDDITSELRDGVGNLNRWSQSTGSSRSETNHQTRDNGLSRTLSFGQHPYRSADSQPSLFRNSTVSAIESAGYSSPDASKSKLHFEVTQLPLTALPPIFTGSAITRKANREPASASAAPTASTGSILQTSSSNSSHAAEYFDYEARAGNQTKQSPRKKFLFSRGRDDPSRYSPPRWATSAVYWKNSISPKSNRGGKTHIRNPSTDTSRVGYHTSTEDLRTDGKHRGLERTGIRDAGFEGADGARLRTRERREKDKKIMLSKALQKANAAVLLDNAQNVEGAIDAYEDACNLLQRVILRTSADEDRRKLDVVWTTYQKRIQELEPLDSRVKSEDDELEHMQSLPATPLDDDSTALSPASVASETYGLATAKRSSQAHATDEKSSMQHISRFAQSLGEAGPSARGGLLFEQLMGRLPLDEPLPFGRDDRLRTSEAGRDSTLMVRAPVDQDSLPPPLSPRHPPTLELLDGTSYEDSFHLPDSPPIPETQTAEDQHQGYGYDSVSWLNTIDESGPSSRSSSMHSLSSQHGVRRKHLRDVSGTTEAEFDAALDAAVEAAYDDGYEAYDFGQNESTSLSDSASRAIRNVQLAKEKVREAEREEAVQLARMRERERLLILDTSLEDLGTSKHSSGAAQFSEDEHMFDELTRDYITGDLEFELRSKSALPQDFTMSKVRQSDSSNASGGTGKSSIGSYPTTTATSLSTVSESPLAAALHSKSMTDLKRPAPPPSAALPSVPAGSNLTAYSVASSLVLPGPQNVNRGLRSRRFSGQDAKQLKIETFSPFNDPLVAATQRSHSGSSDDSKAEDRSAASGLAPVTHPIGQAMLENIFKLPGQPASQSNNRLLPSPLLSPNAAHNFPSMSPANPALFHTQAEKSGTLPGPSPGLFPSKSYGMGLSIRKNRSTSNLKQRYLSQSPPERAEILPPTPMSTTFSTFSRPKILPTPSAPGFGITSVPSGGAYLFDSDIHGTASSPSSPDDPKVNHPLPLEPCPESFLLRPFWFLRCVYQTLAHAKGGYITNKLFVPREVWMTRGVRIKNVEEKISSCDVLTAGLAKIRSADTLDADAVLEEMQGFELLLDQVQSTLSKKLGSEVGVHSISSIFRDGPSGMSAMNGDGQDEDKRTGAGKGFRDGWRKLRSKSSGSGIIGQGVSNKGDFGNGGWTIASVPITGLTSIRFTKRRDGGSDGIVKLPNVGAGPHAQYMSALARLCDAVSVLDQIARQVEDPGLKHSSPTHVGLELSARHAAEFFGFYICRFIISDLTMLLEKSIKRGTEFVLT